MIEICPTKACHEPKCVEARDVLARGGSWRDAFNVIYPEEAIDASPAIVMAPKGADHEFKDFILIRDAWLTAGPLSMCIKEHQDEGSPPLLMIEVWPAGHEDAEPVARLEVSHQVAQIYQGYTDAQMEDR